MSYLIFTIIGFCLGSTMFAYLIPMWIKKIDIRILPADHNPGVANAYTYGGFLPGTLSLICELGKGCLPVLLCRHFAETDSLLFVPVLIAPVLGHAFPFFQREKGGKAIAVSFGVMIALFPEVQPLFYLIVFYLLFSLVLVLRPHSFRTVITFGLFTLMVFLQVNCQSIRIGCLLISLIVTVKHLKKYQGEPISIQLFARSFSKKVSDQ